MATKGKSIGYACEWHNGPSLAEQAARLRKFRCWNIYEEKPEGRPHGRLLTLALLDVRPGDYFVVLSLTALGNSYKRVAHVLRTLQEQRVDLRVLDSGLDTRGEYGDIIVPKLLELIGIFESARREAVLEGLAKARAKGRIGGRRPVMSARKIKAANELRASGYSAKAIANKLGVSRASLYNNDVCGGKNKGRPRGATQGAVPVTGSDDFKGHPTRDSSKRQQVVRLIDTLRVGGR
jgi:DNA invertase Pin-like site-specific DNA recombinase